MARRTVTTTKTERESRVTSRKSTNGDADAPASAEASGGMGYADAIVFITTILLIAAFLMTDYMLGKQFGKGMFFK
jgi:hypothetical protein